jgi:DNA-binding transcriptional MerR regulator
MQRLVTTSQAAQLLNLSIQGVHYRIKKGQLKSQKKDGKVYVYIDKDIQKKSIDSNFEDNLLIKAKDEQILLLKKSIKWLKNRYESEIKTLEKNQKQIIKVFKSEINLLQQAFNEMRNIYKIEHNATKQTNTTKEEFEIMDLKDFYIFMAKHGKSKSQVKEMILKAISAKDKRFIYNKSTKEVLIYKSDFLDLI